MRWTLPSLPFHFPITYPCPRFSLVPSLFGVKAGYDENIYTTPLDKGSLSAGQVLHAELLAADILANSSEYRHVREERNMVREGSRDCAVFARLDVFVHISFLTLLSNPT